MSQTEITTKSAGQAATVRTYAFLLFGLLFWPLLIAAHVRASRNRASADPVERSHAGFQYQTTTVALILGCVLFLAFLVVVFGFPPEEALAASHWRMRGILFFNLGYWVALWAALRAVRGLYLAGLGKAVQRPALWTLWAKPAD
ncbi:hypothetical protein [Rhizobium sp. AAP43]|uniref:hypothetical protein n=1 Tax=Rhizobium sp. AAP43 TaxID=1523420 RepID=UPI0006B97FD6|nr:hypothetical protein [Rhizobium sp. AAP43]KPF46947.1 hypothetical protein IP76_03565 [Rhizobium sp. AAP43]